MQRSFIVLYNPISGTRSKKTLLQWLTRKLQKEGYAFSLHPTDPGGQYQELIGKIREEGITDVIIIGGDGTVNDVVGPLRESEVRFGIIPMGSGNGLALCAGISKQKEKAMDIILNGYTSWVDGFLVNQKFACMLCGIGMDAEIAHRFARNKRRGLSTYIKESVLQFFKAKPFRFSLESPEYAISVQAMFISIANSNQFGNHFTIAPRASLSDGRLDIVVIKKMNKLKLLWQVGKQVLKGKPQKKIDDSEKVLYFQTTEITVHNPQSARVHIDGDVVPTTERLEFRVLPKAYRLMVPQSEDPDKILH
ncbi:MAG: diacylglycerol kinase family lipid kinase [Taibaiella sp.]|nr:diacylglycerol kinase family lipid kinase [Taibaiella sp.]